MTSLIYIADPMCSWCYAFGPELDRLLQGLPDVPLEIVVGGLRAYNTEAMDQEKRQTFLSHWTHVTERTGLPFAADCMGRPGFVYDTEPACRAVVAARSLAPEAALAVFHAIQETFYAQGRDVTQADVLCEVAASALNACGHAIDAAAFREVWQADSSKAAARADFMQTQRWGVRGFPTLVLERDGQLDLITSGYMPVQAVADIMQALIEEPPQPHG